MITSLILTMIRGYQWAIIAILVLLLFIRILGLFFYKCYQAFKEGLNGDDEKK